MNKNNHFYVIVEESGRHDEYSKFNLFLVSAQETAQLIVNILRSSKEILSDFQAGPLTEFIVTWKQEHPAPESTLKYFNYAVSAPQIPATSKNLSKRQRRTDLQHQAFLVELRKWQKDKKAAQSLWDQQHEKEKAELAAWREEFDTAKELFISSSNLHLPQRLPSALQNRIDNFILQSEIDSRFSYETVELVETKLFPEQKTCL